MAEEKPDTGKDDDPKPDTGKDDDPKPDTGKALDADVAKWKALARKHEAQAKENADAAKRLKELEEADKTEIQKATDKATAAEKRAEEAELRALRIEVAAEKGLSPSQAKRLVGTTKEELEADADELVETFGTENGDGKKPPARKPSERLKGGKEPDDSDEPNVDEIVANIPRI